MSGSQKEPQMSCPFKERSQRNRIVRLRAARRSPEGRRTMTDCPISTRRHGGILIVTSNNPPVNALGAAVRQGLVAAIEQADADDGVHAVVIACEGQTFFAGADITEFGKP